MQTINHKYLVNYMKHGEPKERIRELIKMRGGNASALAREIGVHPSVLATILSNQETGVTTAILLGLANIGISTNWILTGKGSIEQPNISSEDLKLLFNKIEILESLIKRNGGN